MRRWLMLGVMAGIAIALCGGCGGGATAQVDKEKHAFGKLATGLEHLADSLSRLQDFSSLPTNAKQSVASMRKAAQSLRSYENILDKLPELGYFTNPENQLVIQESDSVYPHDFLQIYRETWLIANLNPKQKLPENRIAEYNAGMIEFNDELSATFKQAAEQLKKFLAAQDTRSMEKSVDDAYGHLLAVGFSLGAIQSKLKNDRR